MNRASGLDPAAVELRKEVNFCCPIPDCNNVILTYHHFDPPWRVRQHNDPQGMIALCPVCHGFAEGGRWTNDQLRHFKKNPKQPGFVRNRLGCPDLGKKALYKLADNFVFSCPVILTVADIPIMLETQTPAGDSLFSLAVLDESNGLMLQVIENSVSVDALQVWDCFFNTQGNHIVIRKKKGAIALDLRLRRLTIAELTEQIQADGAAAAERFRDILAKLPWSLGESIDPSIHSGLVNSYLREVSEDSLNSDGKVVVVDIARARLHANGRLLLIRNGVVAGYNIHGCLAGRCGGAFSFDGIRLIEKLWPKFQKSFGVQEALIVQREKLLCEMNRAPNSNEAVEAIYREANARFPAIMAVASGLQAFRIGQRNPSFLL
jgi:hypothetical protein